MKKILLAAILPFCAFTVIGQVVFSKMPKDSAIIPRNLSTNKGTVEISGTVNHKGTQYTAIKVKKYRNNILKDSFITSLTYTNHIANFSFSIPVTAELVNYKFAVYGVSGNTEIFLQNVKDIAAGDAFIIQGQSNAAAGQLAGSSNIENQSNFIRVWGSGSTSGYISRWNIANGDIWDGKGEGNAGQWGLRLARLLLDAYKIPIAIFNGANSGQPISWFQRDDTDSLNQNTNYGRLLKRITETGFNNNIRAIFWYQGEADSHSYNSIKAYKNSFNNLYNSWSKDYPGFEHLYIIQIKQGCSMPLSSVNKIQEAHRELASEISNASIFATNGIEHAGDECHYNYDTGYRTTGDFLFPQVNRDIYKASDMLNIESPQIVRAVQTGSKQITLYLKNKNDSYIWEAGTEKDFIIDSGEVKVSSGLITDSMLILTLNKKASSIQNISFRGHIEYGGPCLRNLSGEGLTGFYNMQVSSSITENDFIAIENKKPAILITPNPVHNNLFLQYHLLKPSDVFISVTDVTGRVIEFMHEQKQLSGNNIITVHITALAAGTYFIKLQANDFSCSGKFIKE